MKTLFKTAILAAACMGAALADGLIAIHPGYVMTDIQPTGNSFLVGGVDFFSDGRMAVCTWGNPGEVWIVKGAEKGTTSTVTTQRYAYGLQQVLGCKVVDDTLYVMQMGELTQLVDTDGDGKADQYNRVNNAFATSESLLGYAYDVEYLAGYFYAVLSADVMRGGYTAKPSIPDRSVFIKMGRDNSLEIQASGFRNPNGMAVGFGNRLFCVDNQGSWEPSSKIIYLEKGHFYGHRTEPANTFQDQPETWPMVWLPYGSVDRQPGNIEFIKQGVYKNQFFFAEPDQRQGGQIYRISVEDVNGVMQGAILPFSGGIGTGVMRVVMGPGNAIYAGQLGSTGSWNTVSTMTPGLKRFTPKDDNTPAVFEILNVRSTGTGTMELEFTKPVAAVAATNFAVDTWTFTPVETYGGGNQANQHTLAVTGATLKPDGKTVVLNITGLTLKYLIHIKLNGVKSTTGEAPWTGETWFTLNAFGPGKVPGIAGCMDSKSPAFDPTATVSDPSLCVSVATKPVAAAWQSAPVRDIGHGLLRLELPESQAYTLRMFDIRGTELSVWKGVGSAEIATKAGLTEALRASHGVYLLRLEAGFRSWSGLMAQSL